MIALKTIRAGKSPNARDNQVDVAGYARNIEMIGERNSTCPRKDTKRNMDADGRPLKIYVASSWKNAYQPLVVDRLRNAGHEVYDFRNPPNGRGGFHWSEIDPAWKNWTPDQYIQSLKHAIAQDGFHSDKDGMDWADVCILVLPSGRSAHLEAGYMAGQGKLVIAYIPESVEPELMNLLLAGTMSSLENVVSLLDDFCRLPSR